MIHGEVGKAGFGVRISGGKRTYTDSTWATVSDAQERAAWLAHAYSQYGFVYTVVPVAALTKVVALVGRNGNLPWQPGGVYLGHQGTYIAAALAAAAAAPGGVWGNGVCPATVAPVR